MKQTRVKIPSALLFLTILLTSINLTSCHSSSSSDYIPCEEGTSQVGSTSCGVNGGHLSQTCVDGGWVDTATCLEFTYLGEGECRQGDGNYPLKFSYNYSDLTPHTDGTNSGDTQDRCEASCLAHLDWCLAVEIVTRDIWPTPECRLVTDRATFEAAGLSLENDIWGGAQTIDGNSWQTYCGGTGDCTQTDWAGGSLNPREGYHCSLLDEI
ncbi:MAG: hypothetical protein KKB30_14405 [Proteobacteria bacterium]|nr:hypothetical protein [Pseudomonadota bacterium]MBU1715582.1 hypothetical protein [Pseudomonadota bacterium]